ncbi:E3 ubiquitin-protein ligase HOS1 [Carica papaya]|uniref:E3 ubiquitin-protein ligase HOS1 n=1 Tax=Carica papaya TaxID=3649 RepID=UPI000B8CC57F|nr:E3 ubiquitin-protein ligase HOS1 [Carica papaya]
MSSMMSSMGDIYNLRTEVPSSNLRKAGVSSSKPLAGAISKAKSEEAVQHLASIDLNQLCKEAKIERCRATRDLRSCGRYVHYVLNSCGHASLCTECGQRCDTCPICRIPIQKNENTFRLRLYYECIDGGLISKKCDERFQDIEDGEDQLTADVERLYSLFDVALENNLISLICHYVTDVCMDETAVSSDPVIAFLLDEVVIKDWIKRTFKNILTELGGIYNLEAEGMKAKMSLLLKYSMQLAGISSVLEVLESSFKGTLSAQLQDLHQLQENILKTKQHVEVMIWGIRHQFLENVISHYTDFASWNYLVRERKSAAIRRAWPDVVNHSAESRGQDGSLFIEDALTNLDIEQSHTPEESELASLQKYENSSFFRSKIEGVAGCYPFENIRAAIDILFLHGGSDLVVAKQAIFLYYMFDRHWTVPDEHWRHIIDDFAAIFDIPRHLLLESFIFYLLDDHTNEALKEACHLLPEICGPTTHPKIARVLLERQNPETALMVLRWSGCDGGSRLVSLSEAVTAVRVRVSCALVMEAFTYQRMLCTKIKEKKFERKLNYATRRGVSDDPEDECKSWVDWMETLVTEFCCLCIWRNWIDQIIELPWNSDEEKYLHKCLLDSASDDPLSSKGSLLVVFYLQRYRYDKCMELLPAVQQQQLKTGQLSENAEAEMAAKSKIPSAGEPNITILSGPSSADSSLLLREDHDIAAPNPSVFETPTKLRWPINNPSFGIGNAISSIRQEGIFSNAERGQKSEISVSRTLSDISIPGLHCNNPTNVTPFKEINRSSSRALPRTHLMNTRHNKISLEAEPNRFSDEFRNANSPSRRGTANPVTATNGNSPLDKISVQNMLFSTSGKRVQSERDDGSANMVFSNDAMDISWSFKEEASPVKDANMDGGLRWRSDETSDEEQQSPAREMANPLQATPVTGRRRRRFAKR